MSDRSGTRGGNVRELDTARSLHEEHKAQITGRVREAIRQTFREKGQLHADDLAHLEIPPEHQSIIGSQIARLVNAGYIVATGRRKCAHPAANGRKANVYGLTEPGRAKLAEVSAGVPSPQGTDGVTVDAAPRSASAELGEPERLFTPPPLNPLRDQDAA